MASKWNIASCEFRAIATSAVNTPEEFREKATQLMSKMSGSAVYVFAGRDMEI